MNHEFSADDLESVLALAKAKVPIPEYVRMLALERQIRSARAKDWRNWHKEIYRVGAGIEIRGHRPKISGHERRNAVVIGIHDIGFG
ncbi:hypothetical protein [Pendulispora rubella]|uniref:hypothetical protein n=1 Tax=Pendulispora rubella TaxID=2741070 RepID=UPI0030E0D151